MDSVSAATPSPHVRRWIADCLLDGFMPVQIVSKLAIFHPDIADPANEVELIRRDPVLQAGLAASRMRNKLESLMEALARQLRQSNAVSTIPVVDDIAPRRFFDDFYFANRPVLLRGLTKNWKALSRWTPSWFAERFGEIDIEVQVDRDSDPRYEERFDRHRGRMRLAQFVDNMLHSGNDVYLAAKNHFLNQAEFSQLHEDFGYPKGILDQAARNAVPRLWMGGAGTITPLHHDSSNILFAQVVGRKLVRLIPPYEIGRLANERACFSAIDIDRPDFARFPAFRKVSVLEAVVAPGELLLLPIGWWHAVRSLETSISLSFQNFAVPGGPVVWHHMTPPKRAR
jgi:hypothetical protein